jgi:NADH:ubiquinone oxidoreductase subunit 6 (subunit J)
MDVLVGLLVLGTLICAWQAVRALRLLAAALWLAGVSIIISILLYLMGAQQVAVIELSIGAGLVTILFVFAISIAGDDAMRAHAAVPIPLALGLAILTFVLLSLMTTPLPANDHIQSEPAFSEMFWEGRALDALVQVVLIFSGVLGLLGILSEPKASQAASLQEENHADSSASASPAHLEHIAIDDGLEQNP